MNPRWPLISDESLWSWCGSSCGLSLSPSWWTQWLWCTPWNPKYPNCFGENLLWGNSVQGDDQRNNSGGSWSPQLPNIRLILWNKSRIDMAKAIWFYRLDPEWYSDEDVGIASSTLFWDLHWKMAFPSALKMFLLIEIHNSRCPNTSHASRFVFFSIVTNHDLQISPDFQHVSTIPLGLPNQVSCMASLPKPNHTGL